MTAVGRPAAARSEDTMNRRQFLHTGVTAVMAPLAVGVAARTAGASPAQGTLPPPDASGWIPLFNGKTLGGWYCCLQKSGVQALPNDYVRVENGEIRLLAQAPGTTGLETGFLATTVPVGDCRMRIEYHWGANRFAPRVEAVRDNGVLYHIVGEDRVYPSCVEFQLIEGNVGDASFLTGTRGMQGPVAGFPSRGRGPAPPPPPAADGTATPARGRGRGGSRNVVKEANYEIPNDWNVLEIVMRGNQAVHLVNGQVATTLVNLEQPDPNTPGQFLPLTSGKFGFQLYFAELRVRRVALQRLT
jgi:hypothetical protein